MRELDNQEMNIVTGGSDGCFQNFGTEDIFYYHTQTITSTGHGGVPPGNWECFNGVWVSI